MTAPHRDGPIRVLHLISALGDGGAQRQLALLLRTSDPDRVEHAVACYDEGHHGMLVRRAGRAVVPLPRPRPMGLALPFAVARSLRALRPDVVHTWLWLMDVVGTTVARCASDAIVVVSERNSRAKYDAQAADPWLRLRNRCRRHLAHAAVANSYGGRNYLVDEVRFAGPVRVIRNGLDLEAIDAAPRIHLPGIDLEGGPRILAVGRLHPQKNVRTLLEAFAGVAARLPQASLLLCGDGPERTSLEKRARTLGVSDRVHWLGFREDVWSVMKSCDMMVHPALTEGHPNVVLEAAAARLPLCVSDIAPHRELEDVHAIAGLFQPMSVVGLAAAIETAWADEGIRRRRIEAGRLLAERHSAERMAARFEAFYRECLAERLRPGRALR